MKKKKMYKLHQKVQINKASEALFPSWVLPSGSTIEGVMDEGKYVDGVVYLISINKEYKGLPMFVTLHESYLKKVK